MDQKISSAQIVPEDLNPRCDLHLEDSNPELSHNTPDRDGVPLSEMWLETCFFLISGAKEETSIFGGSDPRSVTLT